MSTYYTTPKTIDIMYEIIHIEETKEFIAKAVNCVQNIKNRCDDIEHMKHEKLLIDDKCDDINILLQEISVLIKRSQIEALDNLFDKHQKGEFFN